MPVRCLVRRGAYADSVTLLRVAAAIRALPGVDEASLVLGTDVNKRVLAEAGLMCQEADGAGPDDLIVAARGAEAALERALAAGTEALARTGRGAGTAASTTPARARTLAAAAQPGAVAVISTPGRYAAAEALKALRLGMHVLLFSDHVSLRDEQLLKREARRRGLLLMGPDCGTAIVGGVPLGFANEVRSGPVGLVGASGTGLQQVSCLLDTWGVGVSHVIGAGSRDLSSEIGGATTLAALDALAADPTTEVVGLVSKPPAPEVAERVLARAAGLGKPVVACLLGAEVAASATIYPAPTLEDAARRAAELAGWRPTPSGHPAWTPTLPPGGAGESRLLRALFSGGTFAHEARTLLEPCLGPIEGGPLPPGAALPEAHLVLDLGDDAYTAGRLHPMLDPAPRAELVRAAARDPRTAVILLDVVLGHGAAADPAGAVAPAVAEASLAEGPVVVAFVVGTARDPQGLAAQERALSQVGAVMAPHSTAAVRLAAALLTSRRSPT
jgi:FdrA protein